MLILASTSRTRRNMLNAAAIPFDAIPSRVDEQTVKDSLLAEGLSARDVADALAEMKALRVRSPGLVLGCDQTAAHGDALLSKPEDQAEAVDQLKRLRGGLHRLHSAAVIAEDGRPVWRVVRDVTLHMRSASDAYIDDYVARNWEDIRFSAGSYTIEGEGARLFHRIDGDYHAILGLPLLPLIDYLITRGEISA